MKFARLNAAAESRRFSGPLPYGRGSGAPCRRLTHVIATALLGP
jgi:hypothetical protein